MCAVPSLRLVSTLSTLSTPLHACTLVQFCTITPRANMKVVSFVSCKYGQQWPVTFAG